MPPIISDPSASRESLREREGREAVGGGEREGTRLQLREDAEQLLALGPAHAAAAEDELAQALAVLRRERLQVAAGEQRGLGDREQLEEGQAAEGGEHRV